MNGLITWLGSEESGIEYYRLIQSILQKHGSLGVTLCRDYEDDDDGNPVTSSVIQGKLAVLSVTGSTISKTTGWSRYFGVASYEDIREAVINAAEDQNIKAIILKVDSGGGHAKGVSSLGNFISNISSKVKPVFTYADGTLASAALWYGSSAKQVVSNEETEIGSLGVLAIHMEYTKMLEEQGIKPTVFRTSPFKALGTPYEKLTEEAAKSITDSMQIMHDSFVGAVASNRGLTPEYVQKNIATGKMYRVEEAKRLGLVDHVMSIDETVARLLKGLDNTSAT